MKNLEELKISINNFDVEVSNIDDKPHFSYFVCTCKEEDQKYWNDEMQKYKSDIENDNIIVSTMILDLAHNYDMVVDAILCDMWFGIGVIHKDYSFHIECDSVEYGLLCSIKISEEIHNFIKQ